MDRLIQPAPLILDPDHEKLTRLEAISMLARDSLEKLRRYTALSQGAIVEVGSYIGGATCAIADAVRDTGRLVVAIEPGGSYRGQPYLPSDDILKDWRANIASWNLTASVHLIPKLAHEATEALAEYLHGVPIGLIFIDADGAAGPILDLMKPWLADGSYVVLDDYADDVKGSQVRQYVDASLANGSLVQLEFDDLARPGSAALRALRCDCPLLEPSQLRQVTPGSVTCRSARSQTI